MARLRFTVFATILLALLPLAVKGNDLGSELRDATVFVNVLIKQFGVKDEQVRAQLFIVPTKEQIDGRAVNRTCLIESTRGTFAAATGTDWRLACRRAVDQWLAQQ